MAASQEDILDTGTLCTEEDLAVPKANSRQAREKYRRTKQSEKYASGFTSELTVETCAPVQSSTSVVSFEPPVLSSSSVVSFEPLALGRQDAVGHSSSQSLDEQLRNITTGPSRTNTGGVQTYGSLCNIGEDEDGDSEADGVISAGSEVDDNSEGNGSSVAPDQCDDRQHGEHADGECTAGADGFLVAWAHPAEPPLFERRAFLEDFHRLAWRSAIRASLEGVPEEGPLGLWAGLSGAEDGDSDDGSVLEEPLAEFIDECITPVPGILGREVPLDADGWALQGPQPDAAGRGDGHRESSQDSNHWRSNGNSFTTGSLRMSTPSSFGTSSMGSGVSGSTRDCSAAHATPFDAVARIDEGGDTERSHRPPLPWPMNLSRLPRFWLQEDPVSGGSSEPTPGLAEVVQIRPRPVVTEEPSLLVGPAAAALRRRSRANGTGSSSGTGGTGSFGPRHPADDP